MEVLGKNIEEGDVVHIKTIKGRSYAGFAFKPALLTRVFNVPFTSEHKVGVTHLNLKNYDLSLNPLKILETLQNVVYKIEGIPVAFKEKEIESISIMKEAE